MKPLGIVLSPSFSPSPRRYHAIYVLVSDCLAFRESQRPRPWPGTLSAQPASSKLRKSACQNISCQEILGRNSSFLSGHGQSLRKIDCFPKRKRETGVYSFSHLALRSCKPCVYIIKAPQPWGIVVTSVQFWSRALDSFIIQNWGNVQINTGKAPNYFLFSYPN